MDYIQWNKEIWEYFFKIEIQNKSVVLAASDRALKNIGNKNNIANPGDDFFAAIMEGPIDSNPYRFPFGEGDSIFKKAKWLQNWWRNDKDVYIIKGTNAKLQRWNSKDIPPYIGYLFFLILNVESNDPSYWDSLSEKIGYIPKTSERKIILDLFEDLKNYTQKEKLGRYGYLYCESVYNETKSKHYVGRIYSQLPLTQEEEKEIKASLLKISYNINMDSMKDEEVLKEIIFKEKKYLNPPTRAHLADESSLLKNIVEDYLIQNIEEYLKEIQVEELELQKILEKRKITEKPNNPEHHQFIESINSQLIIRDGFVIDETVTNLGREGYLEFWNRNNKVTINLRHFITSNYSSLEETVYFLDECGLGEYRNTEKRLIFKIQQKSSSFPLFVAREKTGRKLFRILEDNKIVYQNHELYMFSAKEFIHPNLSYIQKVPKQNCDNSLFENTILYKVIGSESKIEIAGRTINLINRELKLEYFGLNDGISGTKSFNCGFPIEIKISGAEVKDWVLFSGNEKIKSGHIGPENENIEERNIIEVGKLDAGDYKIQLYRKDGTEIIASNNNLLIFSVTNEIRDKRIDPKDISIPFYEVDEIFPSPPSFKNVEKYELVISKGILNQILDHLITTGSFGSRYKKFTNLLIHYLREDLQNSNLAYDDTFISSLREELINTLNIVGIIDVTNKPQENIQLIKPYWWNSSLNSRNYVRGAICKDEMNRFKRSSDFKAEENYKIWTYKKTKIKIELPDIYTCKHKFNQLPKFNGLILNREGEFEKKYRPLPTENLITDRIVPEDIPRQLLINEATNSTLSLTFNRSKSISYFNWRKYTFEILKDQSALDKLFEYSGIRLLRVQVDKLYNNYQENHYLIFTKEEKDQNWKYTYYERENWRQARFDFIKKINYFDFTFDLEDDQKLNKLFIFFNQKGIFKQEEANDLKKLKSKINYSMQIPLYLPDLKRRLVIYDKNLKIFGVIVYLKPLKQIEKALVALSGRTPGEISLEGVDIEQTLYNQIGNEKFTEVKTLPYRLYYDVPENVADDLAFQLLSYSNYKTEYKYYQPIDLYETTNTCI